MYVPILKTAAAVSLRQTLPVSALILTAAATQTHSIHADDTTAVETITVTSQRLPFTELAGNHLTLDTEQTGTIRTDQVLQSVPGISLFRRADSFTAHPTIQGLTMRGVGANGAGRVLVTLDGVPVNDPFGGWVYWSAVPTSTVQDITIRRGGTPGAYGSQALAGSVEITSKTPTRTGGNVTAAYGTYDTYTLSGTADIVSNHGFVQLTAHHQDTDGYFLLSPVQRGPIDTQAASDATNFGIRAGTRYGDTHLTGSLRWFEENRINGLNAAPNSTDGIDAALTLRTPIAGWQSETTLSYRTRDFANTFASARDDRTTERPVLDQFDVPGESLGFLTRLKKGPLEFGFDGRVMNGDVSERFRNLGGGFTRQRDAGGNQWTAGIYADYVFTAGYFVIDATGRLDRYRTYDGVRREQDLATGEILRDDVITDTSGWIPTGRINVTSPVGPVTAGASVYRTWRLPTLNEYYRPFRVVNDITEANPDLDAEKLTGIDLSLEFAVNDAVTLKTTLFHHRLEDGVGNVTIGFGPGFFELGGFVPPGGVLRQRANIDRISTDGLEASVHIDVSDRLALTTRYQYADAEITAFDANPDLVGRRPVQTPKHSLTAGLDYTADKLSGGMTVRYQSGQYDDDLNTRRLPDVTLLDTHIAYQVTDQVRLFVNAHNLFDKQVIAALSSTGLETLAQRRRIMGGITASF